MRMREIGGACNTHERSSYKFLLGNPEGRRSLGLSRHRCEDNIEVDLKYIELENLKI
jgi:hypothetical protein